MIIDDFYSEAQTSGKNKKSRKFIRSYQNFIPFSARLSRKTTMNQSCLAVASNPATFKIIQLKAPLGQVPPRTYKRETYKFVCGKSA